MILYPRRFFEWAFATAVVAVVLTGTLRRVDVMADDSRQAIITLGAHFSAGIAMLRADHRTNGTAVLNALGYPVASGGTIASDADCREVWRLVMRDEVDVVARVNADEDGNGHRCEFVPDAQTAEQGRVLYWPDDAGAIASVSGRALETTPDAHVYVDVGEERTLLRW